jgi:hypothetical protein
VTGDDLPVFVDQDWCIEAECFDASSDRQNLISGMLARILRIKLQIHDGAKSPSAKGNGILGCLPTLLSHLVLIRFAWTRSKKAVLFGLFQIPEISECKESSEIRSAGQLISIG